MLASINNTKIFYTTTGEGENLILLHGNGEDSSIFAQQIQYFSKKYRVIAVDTRAHGRSERGEEALTFLLFAQDIIALMDFLHIEKAHLLGFSDGGNTALHVALRYPERIKKMVVVGANIFPAGLKFFVRVGLWLSYAWLCLSSISNKKNQKEIWALMLFQPRLTFAELSTIETPTLVMAGEHDMIKTSHTKQIAQSIHNALVEIIPQTGHTLLFTQSEKANRLIECFFA
jgi:pimeloyl-ACP methyl ester carboxylesterase